VRKDDLIMAKFLRAFTILSMAALLLVGINGCRKKESVPAVLERQGWVSDYANVLKPEEKERISATLAAYEKETCHQIFLLIIPSLAGEKITDYSKRTASAWHIGQLGLENGFLVTIAMKEGSVRIEAGSAFEWFVQNGTGYNILKEVMIPLFQQQKFVEGIEKGLGEIMAAGRLTKIPESDKPAVCQ
jgi:uncharacterized membrane protein YgcG